MRQLTEDERNLVAEKGGGILKATCQGMDGRDSGRQIGG